MKQTREKKKGNLTMIGDFLQAVIESRNLTWRELGEKAGINPSMISRALQGKSKPTPRTIDKICKALDILGEEHADLCDAIYNSFGQPSPRQIEQARSVLKQKLQEMQ